MTLNQNSDSVGGDDEQCWYLIAVRLGPGARPENRCTALLCGGDDKDVALTLGNELCFFIDPESAGAALDACCGAADGAKREIDELSLVCDVPATLLLIRNSNHDADATILNTVNTLLDLVYSTRVAVPELHRAILYNLADYCTFGRDVGTFFSANVDSRARAVDAIYWCVGAILSHSFVFDLDDQDR